MGKKFKIDFGDVDPEIRHGGGAKRIPEGDYLAKIVKGELRDNKDGSGRHFNWRLQVTGPKQKGATLFTNTSLKRDALWSLRNLIHAATGKNVAGKVLGFDPDKLSGKIVAITVVDDEYEGKMKSKIDDIRPKEELETDDEDEDEEEDSDEEESEDSDDDEDEDEDLEEVDVEEL